MALSTTQYGYIIDQMIPFTDDKGNTIKDGYVRVFVAGSSTPVVTYRNFDGATNQVLIELDNSGRTKTSVIGSKGLTYKVCVYDAFHSQESPILTVDKVSVIGANITAGAGSTLVTGLDGLTTKPNGFVDASVVGTDGFVALDHTLVTDDLNTDAKVTAVEEDRYVPLLNVNVDDPDSKVTLGRLWQWVLGEIKSLSTTITAFRTGDVIPVDGPDGTAKMSKDDLLRVTAENALAGNVAPEFEATKDYVVSDVVEYDGKIYRFTTDHSAGAWNSGHVENYVVSENINNLFEAVDLQVVTNDVLLGESNASFTSDPTTNTITHIVGQTGKIKIAECIVGHRYVVLTSTTSGYDGNTYIQFCSGADGIGYTGSRFNISGSKLYVTATADYKYMFFNSIMTNAYSQVIGVIDVTGDAELEERVKTERYDVLGASSKEIEVLKSRVGVAESKILTNKNDIDSLEHFDELIGEEIKDLKKISTPDNVTINADDSVSFNGSSGHVCVAESVANKRLLIFVDKDFPSTGNLYFKSNSTKNHTGYVGARYNLTARAEYMVVVPEYNYLLMYSDWTTAFDLNVKIFDVTGNPQLESLLKKLNYLVRFNGVGGVCNGYVSDNVNKSIKSFVVDCWGDSLTQSYDENGVVSCLENAIREKLGVRVNNYGNGGEKILDIAARQGGIPFKLVSDVSIPATTGPATLSLVSSWDGVTAPSSNFIAQGKNGINKCSIAGVDGNISLSGGNIVFTRSASGDAVTARTGTIVYTDVDRIIGSNIQCIWAGQNDTISDLDEFIEKLRTMCRRYDGERYVVLSPLYRPVVSDVITIESALYKAFGIKAIATRQYLNAYGIDVAISLGLIESATAQDLIDIGNGIVPSSLRKDAVHLNSVGYKVLGYEIARILKLLYW